MCAIIFECTYAMHAMQYSTYVFSTTALSRQQLRRLELALDDFCSIFHAKEEDLTADEWAQQLQILSNSAQYNSRVCVDTVQRF